MIAILKSNPRALTSLEELSVIGVWGNKEYFWYFQEADKVSVLWNLYKKFINILPNIQELKDAKKAEIDTKTQSLIFEGFKYAGLTWSMSEYAQLNWTNLLHLPESRYPINMLSKDDELYSLQFADRMSFYLAGADHKKSILEAGSIMNLQVDALQTKEGVINFIDNR